MARVGFFAGPYPGLWDALWWLPWLGLSTNSWWLEWASNPEEHQCWAAIKQDNIRGMMIFDYWKLHERSEGSHVAGRNRERALQEFEKRKQVDKLLKSVCVHAQARVCMCARLFVDISMFLKTCLSVWVCVRDCWCYTWHTLISILDWSDTLCC